MEGFAAWARDWHDVEELGHRVGAELVEEQVRRWGRQDWGLHESQGHWVAGKNSMDQCKSNPTDCTA